MMRRSISDEALRDLAELHRFGTKTYRERTADEYLRQLFRALDAIAEWPLAIRLRTDVRPPIRLYPFVAHNVFYDANDSEVVIVRILHHSADWVNNL
jgi:toxin ParE1/3/4